MSLADELLADFEELGEEEEDVGGADDGVDTVEQMDITSLLDGKSSIAEVAKLRGSEQMFRVHYFHIQRNLRNFYMRMDGQELSRVVQSIEQYTAEPRTDPVVGPVEEDPEYKLIVEANNLAAEIENEIGIIHKFVIDEYSKRFPELQSLVVSPLEYIMTVKRLRNSLEVTKAELNDFLPQATIMVVSVTASTTQGKPLSEEDVRRVEEACVMAEELNDSKVMILTYVESRMSFIAPNLTNIVGAPAAAKIMGVAGGLTALSKMPACNIQVLGSSRKMLSGFSSVQVLPHTGFVYYSELVQSVPLDFRRRAARLCAAKCALAARVDSFHESGDGSVGRQLREDIEEKLAKLQEPPPPKQPKPLPRPDDPVRKKRGGRRVRKMKERYAVSEYRKQANRMTFGEIEEDAYQEDLGVSTGNVKKTGSGRVRGPTNDKKTKVTLSKRLQREIQRQQTFGGKSTVRGAVSGTASSVAFTPLQGLEIVNPHAIEKKNVESNKYFQTAGGFDRVKQQRSA